MLAKNQKCAGKLHGAGKEFPVWSCGALLPKRGIFAWDFPWFFTLFPEQLQSVLLQPSGLSPRAAQGKEELGECVSDVPHCRLCPHPCFPLQWLRLQMTHRNHIALCPPTKRIPTRNDVWHKPSPKAAEGRVVVNSTLLGEPGLYFSWHSKFPWPLSDFSQLCSFAFPFSLSPSTKAMQKEQVFPLWRTSPPGWCGVKGADVAPLYANNIRKLGSCWLGCKMEFFQESAPGALK